jgi:hypothetical protein
MQMIGSKACSCLGENPNCYRCYGTGFYESEASSNKLPFIWMGHFHDGELCDSGEPVKNYADTTRETYTNSYYQQGVVKSAQRKGYLASQADESLRQFKKSVKKKRAKKVKNKGSNLVASPSSKNKVVDEQVVEVNESLFSINKLNYGVEFNHMASVFMDQFLKHKKAKECKLVDLYRGYAVFDYDGVEVFSKYQNNYSLKIGCFYEVALISAHGFMQYEVELTANQLKNRVIQLKRKKPKCNNNSQVSVMNASLQETSSNQSHPLIEPLKEKNHQAPQLTPREIALNRERLMRNSNQGSYKELTIPSLSGYHKKPMTSTRGIEKNCRLGIESEMITLGHL